MHARLCVLDVLLACIATTVRQNRQQHNQRFATEPGRTRNSPKEQEPSCTELCLLLQTQKLPRCSTAASQGQVAAAVCLLADANADKHKNAYSYVYV